jgi:hypothetical protein
VKRGRGKKEEKERERGVAGLLVGESRQFISCDSSRAMSDGVIRAACLSQVARGVIPWSLIALV